MQREVGNLVTVVPVIVKASGLHQTGPRTQKLSLTYVGSRKKMSLAGTKIVHMCHKNNLCLLATLLHLSSQWISYSHYIV
jgi:hypothetical protein